MDYLIIGQGIAGSLLAWELHKRGRKFLVMDSGEAGSTRVSAGLCNPVTGRRMAKSWMYEELWPAALETYQEIEKALGETFFFPRSILRILPNDDTVMEAEKRRKEEEFAPFLGETLQSPEIEGLRPQHAAIEVRQGGWLHTVHFLDVMRKWLESIGAYRNEDFMPESVAFMERGVAYPPFEAKCLVFCDGFRGKWNKWFGHLPFTLAKGEILTVQAEGLADWHILLKGIFLIPMGYGIFRAGSTYVWDDLDPFPTEGGVDELKEKLSKLLSVPFTVLEAQAGIRPTVKDRRPLLGRHPEYPQLAIFNGLGTKGVVLAPYMARHLADHLEEGKALLGEVDVSRFPIE